MLKKLIYIIISLLLINIASAATIYGAIYSFDLEKRNNSIISVDSIPPQTIVSKDGAYSLNLEPGEYAITASYSEYGEIKEKTTEDIKIEKQGVYVLDLILFPNFEEEEELLEEIEEPVVNNFLEEGISYLNLTMFILAIIGIFIIIFIFLKYKKTLQKVTQEVEEKVKKPEVSDLANKVLDFIKQQDGRTTQKDIRKHFPSSEAKISLIVTELEDKDIVKRIKKGRGNIIVLKNHL